MPERATRSAASLAMVVTLFVAGLCAAAERGGGIGYYAAYFTLNDSDVTTLDSLPGHSVGWVDPGSASGYVFPRLQLAALGIDPTDANVGHWPALQSPSGLPTRLSRLSVPGIPIVITTHLSRSL